MWDVPPRIVMSAQLLLNPARASLRLAARWLRTGVHTVDTSAERLRVVREELHTHHVVKRGVHAKRVVC